MKIQSEKYGELLQAIARVMVTKNIEIERLSRISGDPAERVLRLRDLRQNGDRPHQPGHGSGKARLHPPEGHHRCGDGMRRQRSGRI